jgi:hypothetical protein
VVAQAPPSLAQAVELLLYHLRSVAVALRVWGFQSSIAGLRINPKVNFLYAIACGRIFGFEILSTVTVNDQRRHPYSGNTPSAAPAKMVRSLLLSLLSNATTDAAGAAGFHRSRASLTDELEN